MRKVIFASLAILCIPLLIGCQTDDGLNEGTYSGVGEGYNDEIELNVTIEDGVVESVDLVFQDETASIFDGAITEISEEVVGQSSTEGIEVVSGATGSSNGIIEALDEAIAKAETGEDAIETGAEEETDEGSENNVEAASDLDAVNTFLNESGGLGESGIANEVQVIPINHIDGAEIESDFYGFVNFKYVGRDYIKYQVTYLSCTCRSASVNYWQTAYVELSLPESKELADVELRALSFDNDSSDEYLAGFWGDSDPIPSGITYETLKEEYVSYFVNKDAGYLQNLSTINDIDADDYSAGEGRENYDIDAYTGATVSTNNIIRMLDSVIDYHAQDRHFTE